MQYQILMGIERASARAGLAVHVFSYCGGQPEENACWRAGVTDVPPHPAALELAGLLRGLAMTAPGAEAHVCLVEGASVPFVFAPEGPEPVDPETAAIKAQVRELVRRRRVTFERVAEAETPRLVALKEAARRAASEAWGARRFAEVATDATRSLGARSAPI